MSEDAALPLSFGLPREASARRSEPSASRPEPPSTARPAPLGEFLSFAAAPPLPAAPSAWDADDEVCRDETNWCEARRFGGNGAALLLHEEILDFWAAFRPTASEEAARAGAVARVRALASELWPRSRVASFGSYSTGLHLPTSDIDLAVLGTGLRKSKDEKVRALRQLAAAVRRAPWETRSLEVVATAKVPILRFDDDATNVSIDVCIEEEDGLKSSALCRKVPPPPPTHPPPPPPLPPPTTPQPHQAATAFPAFRYIVFVLKRWLRLRGLHDTFRGGVGSFLLQLLVVSNLQHPPAAAAARPANDTRAVRGNLGVLLLHFFEVFGLHFNYRKVGISLTDGGSFYVKERRGWGRDDEPGSLSVENPLDPSQDVGEKAFRIAFFRRACQHAHHALLAAAARLPAEAAEAAGSQTAGRAAAPRRLRLLDAVLGGVQAEMGARFVLHAADPATAAAPVGADAEEVEVEAEAAEAAEAADDAAAEAAYRAEAAAEAAADAAADAAGDSDGGDGHNKPRSQNQRKKRQRAPKHQDPAKEARREERLHAFKERQRQAQQLEQRGGGGGGGGGGGAKRRREGGESHAEIRAREFAGGKKRKAEVEAAAALRAAGVPLLANAKGTGAPGRGGGGGKKATRPSRKKRAQLQNGLHQKTRRNPASQE